MIVWSGPIYFVVAPILSNWLLLWYPLSFLLIVSLNLVQQNFETWNVNSFNNIIINNSSSIFSILSWWWWCDEFELRWHLFLCSVLLLTTMAMKKENKIKWKTNIVIINVSIRNGANEVGLFSQHIETHNENFLF